MKIAIFHNYLDNIGGAEMVTLALAQALDADVYSCAVNPENIKKMGFTVEVKLVSPISTKPPFKQQMSARAFAKLNLGKTYDTYIISGDWAVGGLVHNKPNLWYAHGPKRELWDMYEYTRANIVPDGKYLKNLHRWIFDMWVYYNRTIDRRYVAQADQIVCNSKLVQARIKKYYNRDATVIYPPTDTQKYRHAPAGDYWLSVNRTSPAKRIELQTEAFAQMPDKNLIIVATYEDTETFLSYRNKIIQTKPENVTLLSHVTQAELIELYANCRGFITTACEEDFGLTAIEAMAAGKPVIAPNEGGYKESVVHNKTGILLDDVNAKKVADAVRVIDTDPEQYAAACIARAELFSLERFIAGIKNQIGYAS
jgi:glycosyltransferase involved in cell wall biosynthesis